MTPTPSWNRANVLKALGRQEDALEGYARALELKPLWPQALNNQRSTCTAGARRL